MKERIERPVDLPPAEVRRLMREKHAEILLPIVPDPRVTEARLRELGAWTEGLSLAEHVDQAWQHGFITVRCPYGRGGDLLWVREPFASVGRAYRYFPRDEVPGPDDLTWLPAARMPREASRLTLRIETVGITMVGSVWMWRIAVDVVVHVEARR